VWHGRMLRICITLVLLLQFVNMIMPVPTLKLIEAGAALGALILSVTAKRATQINRLFCLGILGVALVLLYSQRDSITLLQAFQSFALLNALLALVFLVPIVGVIFQVREYPGVIVRLFQRRYGGGKALFISVLHACHLTSAVILISAVPLYLPFVHVGDEPEKQSEFVQSLVRSAAAASLWSPNFTTIAMVLAATGLSWGALGWTGFLIGTGLVIMNTLFSRRVADGIKAVHDARADDPDVVASDTRKLIELVLLSVSFLGMAVFLGSATPYPIIQIIPILAILYVTGFVAINQFSPAVVRPVLAYTNQSLFERDNELVLFIPVALFTGVLQMSGLGAVAFGSFEVWLQTYSLNLTLALPLVVLLLGFCGVAPTAAGVLVVGSLDWNALSSAPEAPGIAILVGVVLTMLLSPFSATQLLACALVRTDSMLVGIQRNWLFALFAYIFAESVLHAVYLVNWGI